MPARRKLPINQRGFAVVDLLVVTTLLLMLGTIATANARRLSEKSDSTVCLNNTRRLILAWQIYHGNNDGKLVTGNHGGDANIGRNSNVWATGWLDWGTSPDNTNVAHLTQRTLLAPLLNGDARIFKCPSDDYVSRAQRQRNWKARVRSVSKNIIVGDGNAILGPLDPLYTQVRAISEFNSPGPAEAWVFSDEHPDSINDPAFFPPRQISIIDAAGSFHQNGANYAFADGHAELHRWRASMSATNIPITLGSFLVRRSPRRGDMDIAWLSYHSPRRGPQYYQ